MRVVLIALGVGVGFFGAMVVDEYRRQGVRSRAQAEAAVLLGLADSLVKDGDAGPFRQDDLNALANALRRAAAGRAAPAG